MEGKERKCETSPCFSQNSPKWSILTVSTRRNQRAGPEQSFDSLPCDRHRYSIHHPGVRETSFRAHFLSCTPNPSRPLSLFISTHSTLHWEPLRGIPLIWTSFRLDPPFYVSAIPCTFQGHFIPTRQQSLDSFANPFVRLFIPISQHRHRPDDYPR